MRPSRERQGMTPLKTKSNIVSLDSKKMKCNRRIKWKGMDAMICAVLSMTTSVVTWGF